MSSGGSTPSTENRPHILLVDDDEDVLNLLKDLFEKKYSILLASSGEESVQTVRDNEDIASVVMDIKMPDMDGISAARKIKEYRPQIPIIFHTGFPGEYDEDEIGELEKPFDFVLKGEAVSRLMRSVGNAVESYQLQQDSNRLTEYAENVYGLIGAAAVMHKIYGLIRKVAATDSKAMILGETGTGKELVARAIHFTGRRKDRRLAILNCNHKSPELVESELFGHIRGSFTGAVDDRPGLFEYANGGTVFLDEIGDLDISTQAKLLRVLETGEYQKIGSEILQKTEVRVLCATHKNLKSMVAEKSFREDLYFRLEGVKINLPPLRERREDIPRFIGKFTDRFTIEMGISPKIFENAALDMLINYDWPGNVRQLLETIRSLIVLSDSDLIQADEVRSYLDLDPAIIFTEHGSLAQKMKQYERSLIVRILIQTKGNLSASARILALDRTNLRNKLKLHDLDPDTFRNN